MAVKHINIKQALLVAQLARNIKVHQVTNFKRNESVSHSFHSMWLFFSLPFHVIQICRGLYGGHLHCWRPIKEAWSQKEGKNRRYRNACLLSLTDFLNYSANTAQPWICPLSLIAFGVRSQGVRRRLRCQHHSTFEWVSHLCVRRQCPHHSTLIVLAIANCFGVF